jgi:hypothetical protein
MRSCRRLASSLPASLALALLSGVSCSNRAMLGSAAGAIPGGAYLRATRMVAPPSAATRFKSFGGQFAIEGGARYYYDPAAHLYSGYEVHVTAMGHGRFNVLLEGLGKPLEEFAPGLRGYRAAPAPPLPQPRILREGQALDINLLVTPTGERLFDRIALEESALARSGRAATDSNVHSAGALVITPMISAQ